MVDQWLGWVFLGCVISLLEVSTMAGAGFFRLYDGFVVGFKGGSVVVLLIMIF